VAELRKVAPMNSKFYYGSNNSILLQLQKQSNPP